MFDPYYPSWKACLLGPISSISELGLFPLRVNSVSHLSFKLSTPLISMLLFSTKSLVPSSPYKNPKLLMKSRLGSGANFRKSSETFLWLFFFLFFCIQIPMSCIIPIQRPIGRVFLHCHAVKRMWKNLLGMVNLLSVFPKLVSLNGWLSTSDPREKTMVFSITGEEPMDLR